MDIDDIFPPEDQWKREADFRHHIEQKNQMDDLLCGAIDPIKVGDRVMYREDTSLGAGTIIHIALSRYPYRVRWDDDSYVDIVDWYYGDQLIKAT
jgi:hypothetical protein